MDITAAFNSMSKEVLVPLMGKYGFDNQLKKLVNSYLTGRKTQCKVGDKMSEVIILNTGIGEGSVVGHNFFIMGMCLVSVIMKRVEQKLRSRGARGAEKTRRICFASARRVSSCSWQEACNAEWPEACT